MHPHAGRSPGGQQDPTDGQLGGQVTLSLRLAGNTKEGWAGSCGATECECARLVMAAVNGLEGEADRLCILLVQPVRHLAGFSLLELLAVSVLIRKNVFSSYPLRSWEVKFVKPFKNAQWNAVVYRVLCILQNRCSSCMWLKQVLFINIKLALDDEQHH